MCHLSYILLLRWKLYCSTKIITHRFLLDPKTRGRTHSAMSPIHHLWSSLQPSLDLFWASYSLWDPSTHAWEKVWDVFPVTVVWSKLRDFACICSFCSQSKSFWILWGMSALRLSIAWDYNESHVWHAKWQPYPFLYICLTPFSSLKKEQWEVYVYENDILTLEERSKGRRFKSMLVRENETQQPRELQKSTAKIASSNNTTPVSSSFSL